MPTKKAPAPAPSPYARYRANVAFGLLIAVIVASSYAGDMRAQVAGNSWFMRTLLPFAQQTLSPEKFNEFLRRVNGEDIGAASSASLISVPPPTSSAGTALSSWAQPLPPATVSPKPVLIPGEKRCEFDAPTPLCTANMLPRFIPESCTNGINTGWIFTCVPLEEGHASSVSPKPYQPVCGNGFADPGEQCDDGVNTSEGNHCRPGCLLPVCGDGIMDPGEDCDDGNDDLADGCAFCRKALCGDGICEKGSEDGTDSPGDCGPGETCSFYNFYCAIDCGSMQ